jgi:hypothetical protein
MTPANPHGREHDARERPIIFSAPMVRALLAGGKTQTRRVLKPDALSAIQSVAGQDDWRVVKTVDIGQGWIDGRFQVWSGAQPERRAVLRCTYGRPGDRLWVKETWREAPGDAAGESAVIYRADDGLSSAARSVTAGTLDAPTAVRWRSALFMRRRASRILLDVTSVRIERLQEIGVNDALAEGMLALEADLERIADIAAPPPDPIARYRELFDLLNETGSWEANPWVWVVGFRKL